MNKEEHITFAVEQLIDNGNLDAIEKFFSVDYVAHADKDYKGHNFIKRYTKQLHDSIPDVETLKVEFLNQSSDKITWQRTLTGTHKKNMYGIPPSGKKITWYELVVSRFEEGKITEEWVVSDLAGQLVLKLHK